MNINLTLQLYKLLSSGRSSKLCVSNTCRLLPQKFRRLQRDNGEEFMPL